MALIGGLQRRQANRIFRKVKQQAALFFPGSAGARSPRWKVDHSETTSLIVIWSVRYNFGGISVKNSTYRPNRWKDIIEYHLSVIEV
jgi:hypothetical protein